jgi:hypothetical protein
MPPPLAHACRHSYPYLRTCPLTAHRMPSHLRRCALCPPVFACLQRSWGVHCEGFASPLNASLPSFCSAFPDVDAPFGSLGSFFSLALAQPPTLLSGSFELNPPFCVTLYADLIAACTALLHAADAANSPLSFALVVGGTEPALASPALSALPASPFFRGQLHVGVGTHVYVCGRQHMQQQRLPFRACDTAVYFLQSAAAATKWPVTDTALDQLRAAFEATNGAPDAAGPDAAAPNAAAADAAAHHTATSDAAALADGPVDASMRTPALASPAPAAAPPSLPPSKSLESNAPRVLTPADSEYSACLRDAYQVPSTTCGSSPLTRPSPLRPRANASSCHRRIEPSHTSLAAAPSCECILLPYASLTVEMLPFTTCVAWGRASYTNQPTRCPPRCTSASASAYAA